MRSEPHSKMALRSPTDLRVCRFVSRLRSTLPSAADLCREVRLSIVTLDRPENRVAVHAAAKLPLDRLVLSSCPLPSRASARRLTAALVRRAGLLPTPLGLLDDPAVREVVAASEIVELRHFEFLPLVPRISRINPAAIVVAHPLDVVSQSRSRWHAAHATLGSSVRLMLLRARERRLLNSCDLIAYLSQKDCDLAASMGVDTPSVVLHPKLDIPVASSPRDGHNTVLFVGLMRRAENWKSICWFVDESWPEVRMRNPDAKLRIVGEDPPDEIWRLASEHVDVTGFVENLSDAYLDADVFVAPLLYGAGVKMKVPQAMLYGLPVVATDIAAEGIVDRSGEEIFGAVTNDPHRMAAAIADLLADPEASRKIGDSGRRWAVENMSYAESLAELVATYRRAAGLTRR